MGVTGLWRLIEPVGKPVPVETLENKILAVDISIWLHQMVKGYQDAKGAPLPNAHLIGLFQRLCKLLYFRIKPVFVFDGAFPDLKKETIAKRQDNKSKYHSESERLKRELVLLLGKKNMISNLLGKQISPKKGKPSYDVNNDDMFKLPALPRKDEESESESDEEQSSRPAVDLHSLDIESENFNNLPTKEKYELLLELKETRKQNSWGKLHELPKKSDNFSNFQMQRLLKRRKVQECIEETEKEIGGNCMSLNELESLLNEEGIDTKFENLPTRRIASNNTTRFLLINNVKQALADAKKRKEAENQPGPSIDQIKESETIETDPKDQEEDELQKAIKMSLENVDEHETSACTSKTDDSWTSFDVIESEDHNSNSDSEEADDFELAEHLSMAKDYIKQYSDFTYNTINKIVHTEKSTKNKKKLNTDINQVLEELNQEKSVILDKLEITSSDEDVLGADEVKYHKIAMKNKKSENKIDSFNKNTQKTHILEMSEESVVCIEDSSPGIITVDTTLDEDRISNTDVVHEPVKISEDAKESSEDEFEEVPQAETDTPVIQLTLNVNDVVDEDDIFADIFNKSNETYTDRDMKTKIASDIDQTQEIKTVTEIAQVKDIKTVADIECVKEFSQSSGVDQEQFNALKTHRNTLNDNNTTVMNDNNTSVMETQKDKNTSYSNLKSAEHEDEILKDVGKDTKVENEETEQSRKEHIKPRKQLITKEKLNSMIEEIQDNERDIRQETGRLDRIGRNITEEMTREAQELLRIFGVPYIVAPTEAEAQCAFLESVKLTDGTITDDSDIWLFGGRTVYKNFFNQNKNVMQFLAERIEGSYNLTREQLILFALLVGSDYTTGVNGVGPVTALEILASFPFNKRELKEGMENRHVEIITGLKEFKQWMRAGRKTDNLNLKKKLKNVNISDDFPSIRVVQAYLEPNVEKSEEKFTWGELNITVLRDYTKAKFGWSQSKLDEIIKPVLKRKLDRTSQRKVHDYFQRQIEFHSLEEQMTKRVKVAVQRMRPEIGEGSSSENKEAKPTKRKVLKVGENNKSNEGAKAAKLKKQNEESIIRDSTVRVLTTVASDGKSTIEINIPKSDRIQEIIPQREKDKQELLKNKLKAIELFRKTKIDRKKKLIKRKVITPKDKADLSESSDSE